MNIFPDEVLSELDALDSYIRSQRRQSLAELLRAWDRYVEMLARRVPVPYDDYIAMLFSRDAIQDLLSRATPRTGRTLSALVSHSDSIFLYITHQDSSGNLREAYGIDRPGWWWDRVPEEFERDSGT